MMVRAMFKLFVCHHLNALCMIHNLLFRSIILGEASFVKIARCPLSVSGFSFLIRLQT